MTVGSSDWFRRHGDTGCLLDMVQFQAAQQLRIFPFFLSGCRETGLLPTRGMREEEKEEQEEEEGVLRGEQAEERRRALEHIHRLTLVEQMENGA